MTAPTKYPQQMNLDELRAEAARISLELDGRWGLARVRSAVEAKWREYGWPTGPTTDSFESVGQQDQSAGTSEPLETASVVEREVPVHTFNYPRDGSRMPTTVRIPYYGVVRVRRRSDV